VLGADACILELAGNVHGVGDVDRENDSAALLRVFVPVSDNIADQVITIDPCRELRLDVIALPDLDATEIETLGGCIDHRRDEVSCGGQLGDLRTLDDDIENSAEAAAVASAGRCC
jgi:hypothetical protein